MKTISMVTFRKEFDNVVEEVIVSKEPVQIRSEKGDMILFSMDEWNSIQETLYLLSIPNMMQSIREGEKEPFEEWGDEKDLSWNND